MSDYDMYVKHDHYHHIVDPNDSSYVNADGETDSNYDDCSVPDGSDYTTNNTDNTCTDTTQNGQCDATEISPPDCEPCQEVSQDNGIADVGSCDESSSFDSSSDCGCDDSGSGSDDSSSSN